MDNRIYKSALLSIVALLSHACSQAGNTMWDPDEAENGPEFTDEAEGHPAPADAGIKDPALELDAPTYAELFDTLFAPGKPGHCATAGCHNDPGHNVWLCSNAETCYQGMIDVGLLDPKDPKHSEIADTKRSPLTWFNPNGGNMPLDAQGENEAGRAAIEAWLAAGARP
jgi:hypothetical protein